jgi:DNA (cytosine-5)-methyltransferase 1
MSLHDTTINNMFTVGGLFSGVGGIELGFKQAGFEIKWANEFDKYSSKTYRLNHGDHLIEDDIHLIQGKDIEKVSEIQEEICFSK